MEDKEIVTEFFKSVGINLRPMNAGDRNAYYDQAEDALIGYTDQEGLPDEPDYSVVIYTPSTGNLYLERTERFTKAVSFTKELEQAGSLPLIS